MTPAQTVASGIACLSVMGIGLVFTVVVLLHELAITDSEVEKLRAGIEESKSCELALDQCEQDLVDCGIQQRSLEIKCK